MAGKQMWILYCVLCIALLFTQVRCAQIGAPTGGDKDTTAPKLVHVQPDEFATNVKTNKISFVFNEFVEVQDIQNNLLVSPLPKSQPVVEYKLKTVTVRLKDTLQPNTTYTIQFGNAIKDVNEGNPLTNFYYVFSTGNTIDSLTVGGSILSAETGKADSTVLAMLYKNTDDSAVQKSKPDYIAKPNGAGEFLFENLPEGNYKVYALKDGDGGRTYNSKTEAFAFADITVAAGINSKPISLYYYTAEKEKAKTNEPKAKPEKKLKFTISLAQSRQDLLEDLKITFNNPVKNPQLSNIAFTDSGFAPVKDAVLNIDSTNTVITIKKNWKEGEFYKLILPKESFTDTLGNTLTKADTLSFKTFDEREYGSITLRFSNLDLSKKPVIQFVQGDAVKYSYPLTGNIWDKKLFHTGEYELRMLYDENKNGIWDAGNYTLKKQPEKVTAIPVKITITANFENEKEIKL